MTGVLLSASFPSGERGDEVEPYYPGDIAAAASSAIEAILRSGARLVFGGHPTISPIVLQIADLLDAGRQVDIWQSEYFADQVTAEVHRLVKHQGAKLHFSPGASDLATSLTNLRSAMLSSDLRAAFFIGGMEGIFDEFQVLGSKHPGLPTFLFITPGGMAARIGMRQDAVEQFEGGANTGLSLRRLPGRAYGSLSLSALQEVDLHVQDRIDEL